MHFWFRTVNADVTLSLFGRKKLSQASLKSFTAAHGHFLFTPAWKSAEQKHRRLQEKGPRRPSSPTGSQGRLAKLAAIVK
ncbi:hypothetical protein JOQ06_022405 [Pogonophryne albipinna]|uniref:Uncharacterized protein n=1 Tax=Pogonophryne albipinna TaxID=1090488 RepID=A0AAD6F4H7_9TELE|nr:hypothetical protein JOQ06_022405 [Pogonophryne albipinna]